MSKYLVLGGARSGKSRYAEEQALLLAEKNKSNKLWYVATATVGDSEMQQRIEQHQASRDTRWQLVEKPLDLAAVITRYQSIDDVVLVDCLTLWLTNCLLENCWAEKRDDLLKALATSQASVFFVSNEVGSGVVPLGELSRQFVDESGYLHQALAELCDQVTLVVAGLPLALKGSVDKASSS